LIVTREAGIAERLDRIAFPGMTANFDAAKSAALAISLLDWRVHGRAYAGAMIDTARAFAQALADRGIPVFAAARGFTRSHQFAVEAAAFGGGQTASRRLRAAGFLASGIGLPLPEVAGDLNGLRIGTPELVRPRDRARDRGTGGACAAVERPRRNRPRDRRAARALPRSAFHRLSLGVGRFAGLSPPIDRCRPAAI
jgi:glycine hydroxymethyltransferase